MSSGQTSTVSGTNYDRESDSSYQVTVKADDSEGGTDTISVTIDLTDVEEKPLAPDAPSVSSVEGSTNSLSVTWTAPTNTGRPSITSYDLQYKKSTETDQDWQDGPQNRSGTTATITGLSGTIDYDVQVRATISDGDGPWSGTGSGTTNADPRHGHGHLLLRPRARRQRIPELAPGQALGTRHAATDERGRRTQRVRTHGPRSRHQHSGVAALVGSRGARGARGARRSRWPWGWGSRAPRWSRCSIDYCQGLPAVSAPPDVSAETIEASAILRRHADMNLKPRRALPQVGKIGAHRTDIVANLRNVAPQCCMLVA